MKVFISYSHKDRVWLRRLQIHLRPLERAGNIDYWDDNRSQPGQQWQQGIRTALASARAAVLLVSADYLASDFINNDELPPLLAAARDEGLLILPVILNYCLYHETTSLSQFQA